MTVRTEQARQRLGHALRRLRLDRSLRVSDLAAMSEGVMSASHISNVEGGRYGPSRAVIDFYCERLIAGPEILQLHQEMERAILDDRAARHGAAPTTLTMNADYDINYDELPPTADEDNDDTFFMKDLSVPDGILVKAGTIMQKGWRIRNRGTVPWVNRYLTRVGPRGGPGQLASVRAVSIDDTAPGETVDMWVELRAPRMRSNPVAYFKMTDAEGRLYFPTRYPHGVMAIVVVDHVGPEQVPGGG